MTTQNFQFADVAGTPSSYSISDRRSAPALRACAYWLRSLGRLRRLDKRGTQGQAKARLFGDDDTLARILETEDPKTAKALGRKVKNFDDSIWKKNARRLVTEGNLAKFAEGGYLLKPTEKDSKFHNSLFREVRFVILPS